MAAPNPDIKRAHACECSPSRTASPEFDLRVPPPEADSLAPPPDLEPVPTIAFIRALGGGGHGRVVEAIASWLRPTGVCAPVAVKRLSLSDPHSHTELQAAARLLADPHPNTVTMHKHFITPGAVYLPMELCHGDLLTCFETFGPFSEADARPLFAAVISALLHCQSVGFFHGDVKPENILLKGGVAKLADFGAAIFTPLASRPCPTPLYGAPEAYPIPKDSCPCDFPEFPALVEPYCPERADVWSLGVCIVAAITAFMPWEGATDSDPNFRAWSSLVLSCPPGDVPEPTEAADLLFPGLTVSHELVDLVSHMLHPLPASRYFFLDVAEHPWFAMA